MTILQIFSVMDHLGVEYVLGSCWLTFVRDRHPLRAEPVPECYVFFDRYFRRLRVKPAMRKPLPNLPEG